jgi:hypothetical protein
MALKIFAYIWFCLPICIAAAPLGSSVRRDVAAALLFGFLFMPFSFSIATLFYPCVIVMIISAIFDSRTRSNAKGNEDSWRKSGA